MRSMTVCVLCFALVLAGGRAAVAEDEASVAIEFNKLEQQDNACRAYLVVENKSPNAFETLQLDLVMFDTDGVVAKRLALETAPLPVGKTSLRAFDVEDLACDQVGRVLLNDVMTCQDSEGKRNDCLSLLSLSARGELVFIK